MSTIIKFDLKELRALASDSNSCVIEKQVTQTLPLQPWCLANLKESIRNMLDYKIGKYDKEFKGIVLSYKNLRVLQNIGTIRHDQSEIHFQVQADYFIFSPYVGAILTGIVNKKSVTHLAVLVHRVFNVVIPRPTEEPGNQWIGTAVQEGQQVTFRIVVLDLFGALPYIRGELDESSIKLDGIDVEVESKPGSLLNVSYVDFDKTKPYTHKQIGDGPQLSPTRIREKISPPVHGRVINDKAMNAKRVKSNISIDKSKKRQSKGIDQEAKPSEITGKSNKKHRT